MNSWIAWLIFSAVLMALEIILPGGIVVFLGIAGLIVSLGVYTQLIDSLPVALITWFISSLFLIIFLRSFFMKYFEGDSSVDGVDEDEDLIGSVASVTEDIKPHSEGRIRFRDSTWTARSDQSISSGTDVRIIGRDGIVLLVQKIEI